MSFDGVSNDGQTKVSAYTYEQFQKEVDSKDEKIKSIFDEAAKSDNDGDDKVYTADENAWKQLIERAKIFIWRESAMSQLKAEQKMNKEDETLKIKENRIEYALNYVDKILKLKYIRKADIEEFIETIRNAYSNAELSEDDFKKVVLDSYIMAEQADAYQKAIQKTIQEEIINKAQFSL